MNICIVDDGSSDDTPIILEEMRRKYPREINVIGLPDKGYDIRRVVKNINKGIETQKKEKIKAEYMMISGDDCVYPPHYAERILDQMNKDHRIVIASGDIQGALHPDVSPRGSGRFIRISFLQRIGGYFPPYYGYEAWILHKALQLGYSIENYSDTRYRHLREMGKKTRFKDWGLAMKCLGYHPFEVLYRCIKYVLIDHRVSIGYMRILWDYFIQPLAARADPYYRFFDDDLRTYIRERQRRRMIYRLSGLFL